MTELTGTVSEALTKEKVIEIVDPEPAHVMHRNVNYHKMTALDYIQRN